MNEKMIIKYEMKYEISMNEGYEVKIIILCDNYEKTTCTFFYGTPYFIIFNR